MPKSAHFIGIGGVGMSATAKLLKDSGVTVTGSDEDVYEPIASALRAADIEYRTPYAPENIPADADLIVIGKNAKLVPETNAEVAAALGSGKKIISFPEVLAALSAGKETVVVAGSYGKSTSSALLAHVLMSAGKDPSFFIGAVPREGPSARMGEGNFFIMEGDEYPASNTDPRSKFLLMHPAHVLVTPLAHDHFNIFPTPEKYLQPFYELMRLVPQGGAAAVSTAGALSREFLQNLDRPITTYGVREGEYTAANITWGERTSFDILRGETIVRVETSQLGEHNVENIVGVAALALGQGWVTPAEFAAAVARFNGIRRRLDRLSAHTRVPVFEGFGSSFEKAQSAIAAMKLHFPERRLVVLFEPNTIGWRSRTSLAHYDDVFAGAAEVVVYYPPHDGKQTELSLEEIVERIKGSGIDAHGFSDAAALLKEFTDAASADEAVLLLSSGAMGDLPKTLPAALEQKFPL
jgi:UDP-N-acetylmuramate: L-alanyl-gamma-D-glutamyl-meso-diaminopimelate ligase